MANTTVHHVTKEDLREPAIATRVEDFDLAVNQRLDDPNFVEDAIRAGTPPYIEDTSIDDAYS